MAWTTTNTARARRYPPLHGLLEGARVRLEGPGGYYNAGNAFGLIMGIALQTGSMPADGGAGAGVIGAVMRYLAGNTGAVMLSAATAVFFVSGEAYLRAWAHGAPPDPALNRRGDVLSGVGALLLAVAFVSLGQWMLAVTAGLLHAFGKFGSAGHWRAMAGWPETWPNLYRAAVLASRVPAGLAAFAAFFGVVRHFDAGTPLAALLTPLTLLVCTALWARADLMLFESNSGPSD
jgi:hypothetical protein